MTQINLSFQTNPSRFTLTLAGVQGPPGSSGGVTDGDKGDITVSGSGAAWSINDAAITADMVAPDLIALFAPAVHGHANASGAADGFMAAADKTKLDSITGTNTGDQTITLTGVVTGSGTGSFATTIAPLAVTSAMIADDAVGNDKLANMSFGTIKMRKTAGSGNPENATGTELTAFLDIFTAGLKGLVPASGGGTTTFLRADGTFAAPPGGSPGGADSDLQYNNAGAFAGAADVKIEGGQLRLNATATPATPAAGGVKLFGRDVAGRILAAIVGPSGLATSLQPFFGRNKIGLVLPPGNGTGINQIGYNQSITGTATGANVSTSNRHTFMRRLEYAAVAAVNAVVGFRNAALQWSIGAPSADNGGFLMVMRWGPATGLVATHRAFVGMLGSVAAPTDVNPSTLTNMCGMGYDSGDTNIQFMYNDASGTATKIDLGASFPKPSATRTAVYEIALFAPPGTTQSLTYEITDLTTGAVATGTVTTDIPATTQFLAPAAYMSVGGTSSVVAIALMGLYIETDF